MEAPLEGETFFEHRGARPGCPSCLTCDFGPCMRRGKSNKAQTLSQSQSRVSCDPCRNWEAAESIFYDLLFPGQASNNHNESTYRRRVAPSIIARHSVTASQHGTQQPRSASGRHLLFVARSHPFLVSTFLRRPRRVVLDVRREVQVDPIENRPY